MIDKAPETILPKTAHVGDCDLRTRNLDTLVKDDAERQSVAAMASTLRISRDERPAPFNFVFAGPKPFPFLLKFRPTYDGGRPAPPSHTPVTKAERFEQWDEDQDIVQ